MRAAALARPPPPTWRSAALVSMLATTPVPAAAADGADAVRAMPTDAYFDEYAALYDHIGMLRDDERMAAYHDAIRLNAARHFKGKVVLDVGTGTGILSIWAAQAGARRVFAVEATGVAKHAEVLVAAHGLQSTVTVLRGKMEDLTLPEPVDVILSEWMGYFLLRESMVESVLLARDRWLKPGGAMYPSSARILVATLDDPAFVAAREAEVDGAMEAWSELAATMASRYSLRFEALAEAYRAENEDYTYRQAWQGGVSARAQTGEPHVLLDVDMHNTTFSELFGWSRQLTLPAASEAAPVHALVGWFDVRFCASDHAVHDGAEADGAAAAGRRPPEPSSCVELDTAPTAPLTHWAHTTLLLRPPLTTPGPIRVGLTQSRVTHHDLNLTLAYGGASASYAITNDFKGNAADDDGRADGWPEEGDDGYGAGGAEEEEDDGYPEEQLDAYDGSD